MNTALSDAPECSPCNERPMAATRRPIFEFMRYFAASAGALVVDFGLYRLGLQVGLAYPLAALIGFCAGAVFAYVASVFWVFEARSVSRAWVEFGLFVAIGVAGLLLTEAILWLEIERLRMPALWSKAGAAGIVFFFNFGVRKITLFRASASRAT
jgi:putative flippase GtrA